MIGWLVQQYRCEFVRGACRRVKCWESTAVDGWLVQYSTGAKAARGGGLRVARRRSLAEVFVAWKSVTGTYLPFFVVVVCESPKKLRAAAAGARLGGFTAAGLSLPFFGVLFDVTLVILT